MKLSSSLNTLMLASTLLTGTAFAQEQAAPEPATEAAEAAAPAAAVDAIVEAAPAAAAASSFSPTVQAAIGSPSPGKAMVVFYRPNKFTGAAVGIKVRENDADVVKLQSGTYFVLETEPGAHAYAVKDKDITNIETEAGETYFLVGTISMGMMSGKGNLAPSDAAGFEAALKKLSKIEAVK